MAVYLSTNGPTQSTSDAPPRRLLVATTHGINVIERQGVSSPWETTGRVLEDKHVSALMEVPRGGGIFAGVHNGGLYHSADDGRTWQRRSDGITIEHVYSLGYREHADGVTLYAGTEPVSLFRSRDNGLHWEHLPAIGTVPGHEKWTFPPPPHLAHTKSFKFDERDPDTFFVTVEQGALLQTRDGGQTWREIDSFYRADDKWYKDIHRVVSHPSNPDELYMVTGMGAYRSGDGGATWDSLTGLDFRIGYPDQLIFAPDGSDVLFMSGAERDPSSWRTSHQAHGTVMRSRDRGRTWEDASQGLPQKTRANIEAFNAAVYPGGYLLFAGNTDGEVYASENGGDSWQQIAAGLKPVSKGGHFRNLQQAVA